MAEEKKDKKPKVDLIKQKKPVEKESVPEKEPPQEKKEEKKKIVVVKKKPRAVHPVKDDEPRLHETASGAEVRTEAPAVHKEQAEGPKVETAAGEEKPKIEHPPREGAQPREYRPRQPERKPGEQVGGYRPGAGGVRAPGDQAGGYRPGTPTGYRPGAGGGVRAPGQASGYRPGAGGGVRPPGQAGGYRPGGGSGYRPGAGGPMRPGQGGGFRGPGQGRPPFGKKPGTTTTTPSTDPKSTRRFVTKKRTSYQRPKFEEHEEKLQALKKKALAKINPVPKEISILEVITIADLAKKMNLKASELIAKLMTLGTMASMNQQIDAETATILASEYGCAVKIVSLFDETVIEQTKDEDHELLPRPPIVTIMGHVDHGKTKLLDAIRTANVVASEHGGITQHIGAYAVDTPQGKIVFLDTPGHEAFTLMRARGAQVTDIVVLVVSAIDGVMPQTIEAINHAREAKVPIIVAVNKIDLPDANPERIKQQLAEHNLSPEDWGGHTLYCEVSALKKMGIEELLDAIMLQAEMLNLKANYECNASGKIIESRIDHGRGIVATVIIERGTLKAGDAFVAGIFPGKVRAMFNDKGGKIESVTPGYPAEVLGFSGVPSSGDPFHVMDSEKTARQIGMKRQELMKRDDAKNVKRVTLENLYDQIKHGEIQELKVIIKGDVHGSVEALKTALEKLSNNDIHLVVIQALAGAINENDVRLAATSNALIIGFHVRASAVAQALADREKVEIKKYNIIYDAVDHIAQAMEGMLKPEVREEVVGMVEVRDTFKVPKLGVIAGCFVKSGKIKRSSEVRVYRENVEIYKGKVVSLKRFKDDAREVETNFECGIGIDGFSDIQVGDMLEVIELKEYAKTLADGGSNVDTKKKEG